MLRWVGINLKGFMPSRVVDHDNDSELKYSREQGYFDKSIGIRFAIGILFVISLFFILHFREERVEVLELNSVAPGYVVAQVDFEFFDDEATIIKKQEAVRDVGKIYQIPDKTIWQKRTEFESMLTQNQDWRRRFPNVTFEELYSAADTLSKVIYQLRFTDLRTLQKLRQNSLASANFLIFTPPSTNDPVVLPRQIWAQIQSLALPKDVLPPDVAAFVIEQFASKTWEFSEDIPTQRNLRRKIQSNVRDVVSKVSAGSRIIDQGEKVTTRHIAMLQSMKNALREQRNLWHPLTVLGSFLLTLILTGVCLVYFKQMHKDLLNSNRKLFLLVSIIILTFIIAKLTEYLLLSSKTNLVEVVRYPLFVPFAAILLGSLMNFSIAIFAVAFLSIVLTISLPFEYQGFLILNLSAAMVAILSIANLQRRKEIFGVCGKAWLICIALIFSLSFYNNTLWNISILADIISTGVFLLFTAVLVVGMLPIFESVFRIMTDVTLMEYMDPSNDLLRRLTIEAPGTYQHSVVVGNIAESAAAAIGANALFCRVATLYHDVGKIVTSQYFTENQQGGMNMHQLLTPKESAQVIMAHVSEGVALARKAGLPEPFIDIIKEHHGTTLVYYFYRKQLEMMGGEKSLVDEKEFRYSGPKPRSKESAIIMIADSLEATSRSLDDFTEAEIDKAAIELIREKAEDGQFDECLLTFEELAIVRKTLVKILYTSSHRRIKYPKRVEIKREEA